MTRAPFVMGKATRRSRGGEIYDTTIGWRFVNPLMKALRHRRDAGTAENVAEEFQVSRADQDAFAYRRRCAPAAQDSGFFAREIAPVTIKGRKGDTVVA